MIFGDNPNILIVGGANWIGDHLIKTIIDNKGKVILVDKADDITLNYVKKYVRSKNFVFIEKFKFNPYKIKIDYIINFYPKFEVHHNEISSKYFFSESYFLDKLLSASIARNIRFLQLSDINLVNELLINRSLVKQSHTYTTAELQDYIERLIIEYTTKSGLDASILRIGNIIGQGMDFKEYPVLADLFHDSIHQPYIYIRGDGLKHVEYINIKDAIKGIFRTLFTENISGRIFSLYNGNKQSLISIANKVLTFPNIKAKTIKFIPDDSQHVQDELLFNDHESITKIGWVIENDIDQTLYEAFNYYLSLNDLVLSISNSKNKKINNTNTKSVLDAISDENNKISIKNKNEIEENAIKNSNFEEPQIFFKLNTDTNEVYDNGLFIPKKIINNPISNYGVKPKFHTTLYSNNKDIDTNALVNKLKEQDFFVRSYVLILAIIFIVFVIIYPILKLFTFFSNLDANLKILNDNAYIYYEEINTPDILSDFDRELYFIRLLYVGLNKKDELEKIRTGMQGLQRAFNLYVNNKKLGLNSLINLSNIQITERDFFNLKNLKEESALALSEVSNLDSLPLPITTKGYISNIKNWLNYNYNQSDKLINDYNSKNVSLFY